MPTRKTEHHVLAPRLVELIERNSYFRRPNAERRREEHGTYKKGWELRLVLDDEAEVKLAQGLIESSGMKAGKPFRKWQRWVIPLYGQRVVEVVQGGADLRKQGKRRRRL